jgi:hypothetical protein
MDRVSRIFRSGIDAAVTVTRLAGRERREPAPPTRRTGVASGVLGQDGHGSRRHVSLTDRFVA